MRLMAFTDPSLQHTICSDYYCLLFLFLNDQALSARYFIVTYIQILWCMYYNIELIIIYLQKHDHVLASTKSKNLS